MWSTNQHEHHTHKWEARDKTKSHRNFAHNMHLAIWNAMFHMQQINWNNNNNNTTINKIVCVTKLRHVRENIESRLIIHVFIMHSVSYCPWHMHMHAQALYGRFICFPCNLFSILCYSHFSFVSVAWTEADIYYSGKIVCVLYGWRMYYKANGVAASRRATHYLYNVY